MDSEEPRVEMLNTSGFRRCVAARNVARAFASAMGVFPVSLVSCCSSSGFASSLAGARVGRERIEVKSNRYMSTPLTRSQAAKRYFPKDA